MNLENLKLEEELIAELFPNISPELRADMAYDIGMARFSSFNATEKALWLALVEERKKRLEQEEVLNGYRHRYIEDN